jgi:hypothetical protein
MLLTILWLVLFTLSALLSIHLPQSPIFVPIAQVLVGVFVSVYRALLTFQGAKSAQRNALKEVLANQSEGIKPQYDVFVTAYETIPSFLRFLNRDLVVSLFYYPFFVHITMLVIGLPLSFFEPTNSLYTVELKKIVNLFFPLLFIVWGLLLTFFWRYIAILVDRHLISSPFHTAVLINHKTASHVGIPSKSLRGILLNSNTSAIVVILGILLTINVLFMLFGSEVAGIFSTGIFVLCMLTILVLFLKRRRAKSLATD